MSLRYRDYFILKNQKKSLTHIRYTSETMNPIDVDTFKVNEYIKNKNK